MSEPTPAGLRLEPPAIPALIAAFDQAIEQMTPLLRDLARRGWLAEAWLQDPVSIGVRDWYHWRVFGDGDPTGVSAYERLRAYEAELIRVRDTLLAMEAEYRRVEDGNAGLLGRRS